MTAALEGGWVVSRTPRPHFTPGKDPVLILQEAGWAPGPVWAGGKSHFHRDSIPDRPARSQSLYRLSYRAHHWFYYKNISWCTVFWMLKTEFKLINFPVRDAFGPQSCVVQSSKFSSEYILNWDMLNSESCSIAWDAVCDWRSNTVEIWR